MIIIIFASKRSYEKDNIFRNNPIILSLLSILAFSAYIRNPFVDTLVYFSGVLACVASICIGIFLAKLGK